MALSLHDSSRLDALAAALGARCDGGRLLIDLAVAAPAQRVARLIAHLEARCGVGRRFRSRQPAR